MSESTHDQSLSALETALRQLTPHPVDLSRDRMMFEAGRASAPSRPTWKWATLTMTLLALGFFSLWRQQPVTVVVERTVVVTSPEQPDNSNKETHSGPPFFPVSAEIVIYPLTTGTHDYLRRRDQLLRWGLDALPASPPQTTTNQPLRPTDHRQVNRF